MDTPIRNTETITLSQARSLIRAMAHEQSLLLLSPPGMGKSDTVAAVAEEAGLPCRSLLGTQIAPEDVSGVPRIVGERSVFCPPRVLLPESNEPFCLFLDELPASTPDVQKAFYSLLLERRLGEFRLPKGTWVVAAGNRVEDRALVRALSSALLNRVFVMQLRVDVKEWLAWAVSHRVRSEITSYIAMMPEALLRPPPAEPVPFSTPRAWASLSRALDLVESVGQASPEIRRALAFGRVSAPDAAIFCAIEEASIRSLLPSIEYLQNPSYLPDEDTARWFVLSQMRESAIAGRLDGVSAEVINRFLLTLPHEHRFAMMVDAVSAWGRLGASPAMLQSLVEVTGIAA